MVYRLFADITVVIHSIWILFVVVGFILTVCGFWWNGFFDKWLFRTLHLCGIVYISLLGTMGKACPLTLWENILRAKYDPTSTYSGSFMIYYAEKLVYPDINPLIIRILITFIAVFTVVIFIINPPEKIRKIFK